MFAASSNRTMALIEKIGFELAAFKTGF